MAKRRIGLQQVLTLVTEDDYDSTSDVSINNGSDNESDSDHNSKIENNDDHVDEVTPPLPDASRWIVDDRTNIPKSPFTGPDPGPTVDLDPHATEFDFLELFYPEHLLTTVVTQTNLYAEQRQSEKRDTNWRPVTCDEIKAWFGIRVYMSILQLPQTAMYWSTDSLFGNLHVRKVMTRDRFDKIQQYFHVNDSKRNPAKGQPGHDKLHHVRPIIDEVLDQCLRRYNPHQDTSIDEAMVTFRGRLSFRQYLPAKPAKYGIKVWMRADPENGYTNQFQVYTGREQGKAEVGLASRVVQDMTRLIWTKNHVVNMDNFFTGPALLETLLKNGTYARGTVRQNRKGLPAQLRPKEVKELGQFKTAQKGEMIACVWKEKKPVYVLSTAENPARIDSTVNRKSRNGDIREIRAPSIIPAYNSYMNGVDHADQLRTEYCTYLSTRKWWRYLFWFVFDVAVTNGFIMMKESVNHQRHTKTGKPKKLTMIEYRMGLSKLLIGDFVENERAALTTVSTGHFPKLAEKRGRCKQCSKRKQRHEVRNTCQQCQVHLCISCFTAWHHDLLKNK